MTEVGKLITGIVIVVVIVTVAIVYIQSSKKTTQKINAGAIK